MKALFLGLIFLQASSGLAAEDTHNHARDVHGVPGGVPNFCAEPTVRSVATGAWSDRSTWSKGTVPTSGDRVLISEGHDVIFDAITDAPLVCIEVRGRLRFRPDVNTRMKTANLMVMDEGYLEVGTAQTPIAPDVTAEIIIRDQKIDRQIDPAELGAGIESLGKVVMHGAVKSPTFARLAQEPLAGHRILTLEQSVEGWKPGDRVVIPDTRQLRQAEQGSGYKAQDEQIEIAALSEKQVVLRNPLKFDHKGSDAEDKLQFLPHIGNISRNVIIRSENPEGTRGHMIFMSRADVDLRFVEVRDMGRTHLGVLDNTEFDNQGRVTKLGTNQIGRYAIHFHHYFGPQAMPANGYQFTLIGNAIDNAPKWGVTIHDTHYGLIQDNVMYNTRGAGIVTEDGSESFNVFDHNIVIRSQGSGEFAPRSGYSGEGPDPGGEGSGFWFRGPNNYIRNNVAANADVFGFQLAAGSLDSARIPKFRGADMSTDHDTSPMDMTTAKVLEFTGNEAYGTIQTGVAYGWNGDIRNFRVWNSSLHGVTVAPTDKLTIDTITILGDKTVLWDAEERPVGIWIGNYAAKTVAIRNADIQGMRTGIASPFVHSEQAAAEPGRGDGSVTIENSKFRDYYGIVVATTYQPKGPTAKASKTAIVRNSLFESLDVPSIPRTPPAAISMNYNMAPGDPDPRLPILVYDFNKKAGDNFKLYYSLEAPPAVAPCNDARPSLDGWVCK